MSDWTQGAGGPLYRSPEIMPGSVLGDALAAASAKSRKLSGWKTGMLAPVDRNIVTGALRPAVPMFIQDAIRGVMAPGKAMRGEYGLTASPDGRVSYDGMAEDAAALAGTIGVSGGAVPKMPNTLGMFGGVMAKTADKAALETAQKMAEKGATKQEIWDATGWFKGADDKWRFEIPDGAADYQGYKVPRKDAFELDKAIYDILSAKGFDIKRNSVTGGMLAGDRLKIPADEYLAARAQAQANASAGPTIPLSQAMTHDPLFAAYPQLRELALTSDVPQGYAGMYWKDRVGVADGPMMDQRSTALHELQHGVQHIEDFAPGSNLGSAKELLDDASVFTGALGWRKELDALAKQYPDKSLAEREAMVSKDYSELGLELPSPYVRNIALDMSTYSNAFLEKRAAPLGAVGMYAEPGMWSKDAVEKAYKAHAGEVEARNVQTRKDLTPEQRRAKAPWLTQDVPDERQIVRK